MPLYCSRTPAWATLKLLSRRSLRISRAAPSQPRHCCWSSLRTIQPLKRPLLLKPAHSLHLWSSFSFSKMSTETRTSPSSAAMSQRMVWVDLEMTGLDIEKDQIIEMACIITDSDLNVIAEGPNLIIKQPDELLDGMSDWCKEHHSKSGLTAAVRSSNISLEQAEYEFLSFVRQHTPPGQCPLAGNSVHADKRFLDKFMPQFMYHLHYRIIDVSTIKELPRRWFPDEYKKTPQKRASHRALGDIRESIKELQFYRANVFKSSAEEKKRKIIENGGNCKTSS
ncbi:small fragment nuclease isoform X2 [Periophthalmus magnuspinnatus]|uniref:small fragment nuclease isoform X2 n=1 Tax=Periophthalmus magnuspinnatus TaxID=409849 RepID=UPI00243632D1|nr:small fragment nuclease isoform X2 [Periophthalmus magnuspinnatus]